MSLQDELARFVDAQSGLIDTVRRELRAGRKTSHWMWFVFPQLRGLGQSAMAWRYGIASRAEALAYASHAVLGPRLRECTELVLGAAPSSAHRIFGSPDDLKFASSMTLFDALPAGGMAGGAADGTVYGRALDVFFDGRRDERTLRLLAPEGGPAATIGLAGATP